MQTCKACGSECRKAQVALVLPAGKRGRVCKRCAATGLLVVASTVAPVMRQEPLFSSDPVNEGRAHRPHVGTPHWFGGRSRRRKR